VVVGLAARVLELESDAVGLEGQGAFVGRIGVDELGGPRRRARELAHVDQAVIARGRAIAVEARGDVPMRHDPGTRPALPGGLGQEGRQPEGVIGVPVSVDCGPHRRRIDRADRREGPVARGLARGIDEHEPVAGAQHGDVGEGVQEEDAGRDLLRRSGGLPERVGPDRARPALLGHLADAAHARP
jgi:hypothetical protein